MRASGRSTDDTDLVVAEQSSATERPASHEWVAAMYNASPDSIGVFDRDGVYQEMYVGTALQGRVAAADFVGRSLFDVFGPAGGALRMALVAEAFATGSSIGEYETELGGLRRTVETRMTRIDGDHVLSISRDVTANRTAEQALRRSLAQLEAVYRALPDSIVVFDADDVILSVKFASGMGELAVPERFVGQHVDAMARDIDVDDIAGLFAEARATGRPRTLEYTTRVGGTERWVEGTAVPFADDHILVASRDITERKLADDELRASQQRYQNLVETAAEGIMVLDADYRFTYVNRRAAEIVGYAPDELVGVALTEIQPAREARAQPDRIERRRGGRAERFETTILRKDGSEVPVLVSTRPLIDADGAFAGAFSMVADITDLVRAREARRQTDERLRALVANLTDALLLLDDDGRVVWASASTNAVIGVPPDELIGLDPLPDVPLDARGGWQWALAHPGEVSPAFERPTQAADGTTRWFRGTYCDLRADPAVAGVLVTFRDVTAEHHAAQARVELLRRVAVAEDEERRRLAEGLHDGPIQELAALALRLGTLRVGLDDDPERARRVHEIESGIRHAVGELRALMFDLQPPALVTRGLAASLRTCAAMIFGDEADRVVVDDGLAAEPPAAVSTVAYRIAREALTNAHRHAHPSVVLVRVHADADVLTLTVEDDGVGIPDASLHDSAPGHLGIRAMRERAESAGGRCEITRRDDGGTRVLVELPLAASAAQRS